jgi:hypothetical protein
VPGVSMGVATSILSMVSEVELAEEENEDARD